MITILPIVSHWLFHSACTSSQQDVENKSDPPITDEPSQEPSTEIETCDEVKTLPRKLRRLTDIQFKNSVKEILDLEVTIPNTSFPSTQQSKTFHTFASNNNVTQTGSESILFASEEIIELWKEQIEICPETESTECALSYLKDRVRRSYRREPLDEEWQVFEDIICVTCVSR